MDAFRRQRSCRAERLAALASSAPRGACRGGVVELVPGETLESLEAWLQAQARAHPRTKVATVLATRLPAAVADAWAQDEGLVDTTLAHLSRESRRRLIRALLSSPLEVRDGRGYNFAEVTVGGIPLDEIDPARMESRRCAGLYLVGEMLDVDGRLGGFNFQWAWSSAWVAGGAIARALTGPVANDPSTVNPPRGTQAPEHQSNLRTGPAAGAKRPWRAEQYTGESWDVF